MLALALVWWAWSAFAWATNAEDPASGVLRGVLLLGAGLIFIAGLALPLAYGPEGLLFAVSYASVRVLHLGLYAHASRQGNAAWSAIAGFAVTVAIGMALLIAGALVHGTARALLWLAAAAIDYAGPAWLTRERLRGLQTVAVAHFAERYGLFVIICLGESVVGIGIGASTHQEVSAGTVAGVSLALVITGGLWWAYFDRSAELAEARLREHADPVLAAADAYSYIHLFLVAGIIIFAVGARVALIDVTHPLAAWARLSMCGGVALYSAGHAGFRARLERVLDWPEVAGAAAAMIVFAASAGLAGWAVAALLAVVLIAQVAASARVQG